jgi:predicted nucleic acid-binding protein
MYSIDTNVFIDWWQRRYPPDVFPSLRMRIEELVVQDKLVAPELVLNEILYNAHPDLKAWAQTNKKMFVPHDQSLQTMAKEILRDHPLIIDPNSTHDEADVWVIALAKVRGLVVVSYETLSIAKRNPPRGRLFIPDICQLVGVTCINLLDLMRREKWSF